METIRAGQIFAPYLFDAAEAIDLKAAANALEGSTRARLEPKAPTPAYLQYQEPPLLFDGGTVDLPSVTYTRRGCSGWSRHGSTCLAGRPGSAGS